MQSFAFSPAPSCGGESTRSSTPSRGASFLDFKVEQEADATRVTIDAPRGGEPTLRGLAGMFRPTG